MTTSILLPPRRLANASAPDARDARPSERAQDAAPQQRGAPGSRRAVRFDDLRILIVDDDFLFAEMLPKLLLKSVSKPRLHVLSARSAQEAILLTRAQRFDVVLCDFDLRVEQSGFDVLREASRDGHAPLRILISGHPPHEIPDAPDGTFDAFLEKPMTLREVVPLLSALLHERWGVTFETRS